MLATLICIGQRRYCQPLLMLSNPFTQAGSMSWPAGRRGPAPTTLTRGPTLKHTSVLPCRITMSPHQPIRYTSRCNYTSVKERLGEPGPDPEDDSSSNKTQADNRAGVTPQQDSTGDHTSAAKGSTQVPAGTPSTSWRVRDAADQRASTSRLAAIEAAAVSANPDQAGHPELHRVMRTEDYTTDEPEPVSEPAGDIDDSVNTQGQG